MFYAIQYSLLNFCFLALPAVLGSELVSFNGLENHTIMDDLMRASLSTVPISFSINNEQLISINRSNRIQLDIRIQLTDVFPIYLDSDNPLLGGTDRSLHSSEVREFYCRHPAPTSLILNHTLLKDTKSQVKRFICSKRRKGNCPGDVTLGGEYAQMIPANCDGSSFKSESLFCGNYVNLASLFDLKRSAFLDTPTWSFLDPHCEYLYTACHSCKEKRCNGPSDTILPCLKQCEYICHMYREKRCQKEALHCSKGDVSEWTLKKEFKGREEGRFNCYLKRKLPDRIFKISYRVRIPHSNLNSIWFRVTSPQVRKGNRFIFGDFEAEYDVSSLLPEHVILIGEKVSRDTWSSYEFKAQALHDISESNLNVPEDGFRFMPSEPSPLWTHSWREHSYCSLLSNWKKHLRVPRPMKQNLTIEKMDNLQGRMAYRLTQKSKPIKMKLSLGKDASVLKAFAAVSHVTTLSSSLNANYSHWFMNIKGNITQCPTVLQLKIVEKTTMLQCLHQDVLILCPSKYFHVVATVPKTSFYPLYAARLFIAYVSDSSHVYEIRMEKKMEVGFVDAFDFSLKHVKGSGNGLDLKMFAKFDAITILTGCFILGLVAIVIFSCIVRPSKKKQAHAAGYQQAAIRLGRNDIVDKELKEDDKLKCRQLVPIVFLVSIRVAYSFILTISFITILFHAVNKKDLEVLKDFDEFVQLKINQSNQIALALDQFRESEIKIMTDKAAFLECACDYHIGRIMQNMKDNMTAMVQLNDLIAFDKVSEILVQAMFKKFRVLRTMDEKIRHYKLMVRRSLMHIESALVRYAYKVFKNGWFSFARTVFGGWSDSNALEFLRYLKAINLAKYYRIKYRLLHGLKSIREKLSLSNVVRRLKKPFYPLVNALLAPFRKMKKKVKDAVKRRLDELKEKILRNIPCLGHIDMKKWRNHKDNFDEESRKRCRLESANKFVEKVVNSAKKKKTDSNAYVINSVKNDAALNVQDGDAAEEQYESTQEKKVATLKKISAFYTENEDVKTALRLLRKHSVILILVFDILLITYRNLKTYRFAFMMAAGYQTIKEHQTADCEDGQRGAGPDKSVAQTVIDIVTKPILLFFSTFEFIFKMIFATLLIPIIVFIGVVFTIFYLGISFTYNGLNVNSLEQLGVFKLLSSRLDVNFNLTKESLKEQADHLNKFDLGMYKESLRLQTEELRNTAKQFNTDEIIRIKRVEAELCDIDKEAGCNINFRHLMQKLEMNVEPCVFPIIKARMPDNIYDSNAYRGQLKYELQRYVDALRYVIIRTFYIVIGIIGTLVLTKVMSKVIFKFLKAMGMIRLRNKHIYYELPKYIKEKYTRKFE